MDNSIVCPGATGVVSVLAAGAPAVHLRRDVEQVQVAEVPIFNPQSRKRRRDCRIVVAVVCFSIRTDKVPDCVQGVAVISNKPAVTANVHGLVRRILQNNGP